MVYQLAFDMFDKRYVNDKTIILLLGDKNTKHHSVSPSHNLTFKCNVMITFICISYFLIGKLTTRLHYHKCSAWSCLIGYTFCTTTQPY